MKKMILSLREIVISSCILFSFSSCSKTNVIPPITNNPPKENPPTNVTSNTFTYQGFTYHTIDIPTQRGTQTWMVENFRASKYNDGTDILHVIASNDWGKTTNGARCYYGTSGNYSNSDSLKYGDPFGTMYDWYAVSSPNFAPKGWYVPTITELNSLVASFGGSDLGGGALKATSIEAWLEYANGKANNSSGFTAKGGGYRSEYGAFHDLTQGGYYWTSNASTNDATKAWCQNLTYATPETWQTEDSKSEAISVRLIKDNSAY